MKKIIKKIPKPIWVSMENSWPKLWGVRKKYKIRIMWIWVNISYLWPESRARITALKKTYEAQFFTIQYWMMKLKKKSNFFLYKKKDKTRN